MQEKIEKVPEKKKILKKLMLVLFFLIIIVALVITVLTLYEPSFDKTNVMAQEEIKNLIRKGANYENYTYTNTYPENKNVKDGEITQVKYYIKGNKILQKIKRQNVEDTLNWFDFDTNEAIAMNYTYKKIAVKTNETKLEIDYSLKQSEKELDIFDSLKYLGETTVNDRIQIVVKAWNKNEWYYHFLYYIDKETGLITQIQYNILGIYTKTLNKNIEYDIVKEEDVAKPDISIYENYEVIEVNE